MQDSMLDDVANVASMVGMSVIHGADMPEALAMRKAAAALIDRLDQAEKAGEFELALEICREALTGEPTHLAFLCHTSFLLSEMGRLPESEALLRQAIKAQPWSVSLSRSLAEILGLQGCFTEAIAVARDLIWPLREDREFRLRYVDWLIKVGKEPNGLSQLIAPLALLWSELKDCETRLESEKAASHLAGTKAGPLMLPDAFYLRGLFECYAEGFDEHLEALGYCAPARLRAAVDQITGGRNDLDIVDLGCGTGLSGIAFRPLARHMTGIDLSPRMLLRAGARNLYDRLVEGDILLQLRQLPPPYDLILALDTFSYVGSLEAIFSAAIGALRIHGLFAFTVEKAAAGDMDVHLRPTRRYAHSEIYVMHLADIYGFSCVFEETFVMRREGKEGLEALAIILRKEG